MREIDGALGTIRPEQGDIRWAPVRQKCDDYDVRKTSREGFRNDPRF